MLPKRAGLTNASFKVLSSGLNFLLVPLYIHVYGVATYGALSLLLSLGQYLSVLDVGLTGSLVQERVRVHASGDYSYFQHRTLAIGFLFVVGGGATLVAAATARWWGPAVGLKEVAGLRLAVLAAGWLAVFPLVSSCMNSAYVATMRFGHVNLYNLSLNILPQLTAAASYAWSSSLGFSLTAAAIVGLVVLGIQAMIVRVEERTLRQA